jgi:hypothetical protein
MLKPSSKPPSVPCEPPAAAPLRSPSAAIARGARRIETYCRRRLADCVAVPRIHRDGTRVDLRVGPARAGSGEHLWVRDLDPATLEDGQAVERLARLIRVWIEPG